MENASKALIIAGAILLSILIIGLGMAVFNNASSTVQSANMDAQEVNAHNAQFESYQGKQKGSAINKLLNMIVLNNNEYEDRPITVDYKDVTDMKGEDISTFLNGGDDNDIKLNTTYKVTFQTDSKTGLINKCIIKAFSSSES